MKTEKRLIDKEPLKKFIEDGLNNPDKLKAFGHDAIEILAEIEYAPTVDAVEVVHGRWIARVDNDTPLMDLREKLIELLQCSPTDFMGNHGVGALADHLIAHGVTVQEEAKLYWKPVEKGVWNLTCSACDTHLGCKEDAKHCPECGAKFVYPKAVAPEPPKGD